jgi:two-component system, sensor histidine kinase and response regulator
LTQAPLETVLIVDDTPDNIALLSSLLKGLYRTKVATHGEKAIEIAYSDDPPDIILLDIMMPGMDGYEVCRKIREKEMLKNIPIIFISSLDETLDKVKAFNAGGVDYMTKPFQLAEVRVRLQTHLKLQRLQREREQQNRQLHAQNELLLKLAEQKDEFIKIASHDLKNHIMCILGFTNMIGALVAPDGVIDAKTHSLLPHITVNTLQMQKIIKDFLDFQALEDGQIKIKATELSLNSLARVAAEQNAGHATGKAITLETDLQEDLPAIHADDARISQVIDNLLSNAIKFSPRNTRVVISTREANASVILEIKDGGPGLTAADISLLFVKYAKLSNEPTGNERSTGLGLAICKKMIDMQGGEIGGGNNPEGGSTFWFRFPAAPQSAGAV